MTRCQRCGSTGTYRDEGQLRCLACNRPVGVARPQRLESSSDSAPRTCRSCGVAFTPNATRESRARERMEAAGATYQPPTNCTSCRIASQLRNQGPDYRVATCVSCGDECVVNRKMPLNGARCGDCRTSAAPGRVLHALLLGRNERSQREAVSA